VNFNERTSRKKGEFRGERGWSRLPNRCWNTIRKKWEKDKGVPIVNNRSTTSQGKKRLHTAIKELYRRIRASRNAMAGGRNSKGQKSQGKKSDHGLDSFIAMFQTGTGGRGG